MESDEVRVAHRLVDAMASGDFAAIPALFHPDGEVAGGALLGSDTPLTGGPAAATEAMARAEERWERFEFEPEVVDAAMTSGAVLVRLLVTARSFGTPLVSQWVSWPVVTVRDGLVYRVEVFRTEQEGRLAAGLAVAGDREI